MPPLAASWPYYRPVAALLFLLASSSASAANFTCARQGATCRSAINYAVPNATTYADLAVRFNTTATTLTDILGSNSLPRDTAPSTPIPAMTTIRIPFRCVCGSNGVGQSDGEPVYVVQPGDVMYAISRAFDDFVTNQEIATANNVTDVNHIEIGQRLRIPLPCSCDPVDGADVMHLAYSITSSDNTSGIAAMFGVHEPTLLSLNRITDPRSLRNGQILDIPLPVCYSSISDASPDHNLHVPYGTYTFTAQDCVQCSCRANTYQLDCASVQGNNGCPAVPMCNGALKLGQTNGTGCGSPMCAYNGYSNSTSLSIYTTLVRNLTACQSVCNPLYSVSVALSAPISLILMCLIWIIMYPWKKNHLVFLQMYTGNESSKVLAKRKESNIEEILKGYDSLVPKRYTYSELRKITRSFKDILGEGGYGIVYKGNLEDGRMVAVKLLKGSKGNGEEFLNEVISIRRTSHVNIVNLLGFCLHGSERALIYDYMANGSLDKYIYSEEGKRAVGWEKLQEIAVGIAQGLEYLHRGCSTRIIHFDIKPHNVLLDEEFCPKIADFGLAKLCHLKDSALSMAEARGTIGFIAPEVFYRGFGVVSTKSDVYSYGMMLLEMVEGRKNVNENTESSSVAYFPDWVYDRLVIDLQSPGEVACENEEIARRMILVGFWCIQLSPGNRPTMRRAIEMLEKNISELEIPPKPFLSCSPVSSFSS
ncbi:unnamed protein product [Urochloa decumbens]|uniref:Protein kinase domain-containing protein n=1 Tax=Urochloa decumbens TaxID=240449 RepID=A0ABC9G7H2_9POAL